MAHGCDPCRVGATGLNAQDHTVSSRWRGRAVPVCRVRCCRRRPVGAARERRRLPCGSQGSAGGLVLRRPQRPGADHAHERRHRGHLHGRARTAAPPCPGEAVRPLTAVLEVAFSAGRAGDLVILDVGPQEASAGDECRVLESAGVRHGCGGRGQIPPWFAPPGPGRRPSGRAAALGERLGRSQGWVQAGFYRWNPRVFRDAGGCVTPRRRGWRA